MQSIKVGSTLRIHAGRGERGPLWQPRFFDRALRSVKEYYEKVEYIPLNPVRAGLLKRAEEWQWSTVAGVSLRDSQTQRLNGQPAQGAGVWQKNRFPVFCPK
jgi:hypothetical protein